MDPRSITRSVTLDATVDAAWAAIASSEGLAGWLGASVDVEPVTGAAGTLLDHDGTVRRLVVTERRDGECLGLVWWDDARPDLVSRVDISIDLADGDDADDGDGEHPAQVRVTVTETIEPAGAARLGASASCLVTDAAVADLAGIDAAWASRLSRLAGATAPALVGIGA